MEDMLRAVLDETLRPVLTTRGRGEVMSRLRPVVRLLLDRQAQEIAAAIEDLVSEGRIDEFHAGAMSAAEVARDWGNR